MLTCAVTVLIGFGPTLTKAETIVLKSAQKRCKEIYPEAPCLVKLIKKEELLYNAICGKKR